MSTWDGVDATGVGSLSATYNNGWENEDEDLAQDATALVDGTNLFVDTGFVDFRDDGQGDQHLLLRLPRRSPERLGVGGLGLRRCAAATSAPGARGSRQGRGALTAE